VEPLPITLLSDRMPAWWRPFTVELEDEPLARVRGDIETLRSALSRENAVDAVAYAFDDQAAGARMIVTVRLAIAANGGSRSPAVGDAESAALVAAALADQLAVAPDGDLATLISLLILSADYSERQPAIEGMRLVDYATRQLEHRSASARRTVLAKADQPASELVSDALRSLGFAAGNSSTRPGESDRIERVLTVLAERIDELAAAIDSEHAILREQLRQQSWSLPAWCETAQMAWSDVPAAARPIIAAVELAQRTHGTAPAIGAEALLASVLDTVGGALGRTLDAEGAVAAAGPYIAGSLRHAPDEVLFPLASELGRWRKQAGEGSPAEGRWLWRHGGDEQRHEEMAIALQAYREALALRILGHE
jgi:hypothetical protein